VSTIYLDKNVILFENADESICKHKKNIIRVKKGFTIISCAKTKNPIAFYFPKTFTVSNVIDFLNASLDDLALLNGSFDSAYLNKFSAALLKMKNLEVILPT